MRKWRNDAIERRWTQKTLWTQQHIALSPVGVHLQAIGASTPRGWRNGEVTAGGRAILAIRQPPENQDQALAAKACLPLCITQDSHLTFRVNRICADSEQSHVSCIELEDKKDQFQQLQKEFQASVSNHLRKVSIAKGLFNIASPPTAAQHADCISAVGPRPPRGASGAQPYPFKRYLGLTQAVDLQLQGGFFLAPLAPDVYLTLRRQELPLMVSCSFSLRLFVLPAYKAHQL